MEVALLDIRQAGDNKDFNGGFGTTFHGGKSLRSRLLKFARSKLESIPTLSYVYLSSIFKQHGHNVSYYANTIPNSFDLALIHVTLIRHQEETELIGKLKARGFKNVGVYGPIASVRPELFSAADFIIAGEPEEAVLNIAKTGVAGKGVIPSRPVMDLDSLPFPDWSIFPIDSYSLSPALEEKPAVFVHASRGCPYTCSYCPYTVFGTYRARQPESIVKELAHLKATYGIRAFYFRDPTFSIDGRRVETLCNLMIENSLNLQWGCETRLDLLTIPSLTLMHRAGLRAIKVGIESVDHDLLRSHGRKPPTIEKQEEIVEYCRTIGIRVIAFYIIGIPGATKESTRATIRYSRRLNTSFANFTICTPIPGTKFYDEMKDRIVDHDWNHYDNFHVVFEHDALSKEEILKLQEQALTGYYFRPRYILRYLLDKVKSR